MTPTSLTGLMMEPRKWQTTAIDDYFEKRQRDYLLMATPGAGKTQYALLLARELFSQGSIDKLVIVCHSLLIKSQWRDAAWKHFRWCLVGIDEPHRAFDGLLTTYQQVAQCPIKFEEYCKENRCFVIFDEVHHASEKKSWGESAAIAFSPTTRLCLSGTPFRSDNNPIAFVPYQDSVCLPDFSYNYAQAVADGVCRRLHFPTFDGRASWSKDGLFSKDINISQSTKADKASLMATILDPDHQFVRSMIKDADDHLTVLRRSHSDAAGIVMAKDIEHAKALGDVIRTVTGHEPLVIHKDTPKGAACIDRFRESQERWIVSVRMVSEGVDIPRLRVLCYLTNYMTDMFFWQAVGRVCRGTGDAWVYLPDLPALKKMARDIYASQIPEGCKTPAYASVDQEKCLLGSEKQVHKVEAIAADGFLSGVLSFSEQQAQIISELTRKGLQKARNNGVRLGPPPLTDKATMDRIRELHEQKCSLPVIAKRLTDEGFATKRGGAWHPFTVKKILDRLDLNQVLPKEEVREWEEFFLSWYKVHGPNKVSTSDLISVVDKIGMPSAISMNTSLPSKLTTLGRGLQRFMNSRTGLFKLLAAGAVNGRKLYRLERVAVDESLPDHNLPKAIESRADLANRVEGTLLPKLIKMSDFARAYGIGRARAYDLIPKMPEGVVVKIGDRIRLNEERLKAWIESGGSR